MLTLDHGAPRASCRTTVIVRIQIRYNEGIFLLHAQYPSMLFDCC